jgi:hypothetical protein
VRRERVPREAEGADPEAGAHIDLAGETISATLLDGLGQGAMPTRRGSEPNGMAACR